MPTLYLTEQGSTLCQDHERLIVERGGRAVFSVPLVQVERVLIFGHVQVTPPAMGLLLREGIDVAFLSMRGRFKGRLVAASTRNLARRLAQYERVRDADFTLQTARSIVAGKIRNGRAVLARFRRNHAASEKEPLLRELRQCAETAMRQENVAALLGVEGQAAALYFRGLAAMLRQPDFKFTSRTRHPPQDPVNVLLSLGYTLAGNELQSVVTALGLDPWLGFLHGLSERRPGLPLDLLEEFRAPVVDRFSITLLNRRQLDAADFALHPKGGITLSQDALKRYLLAWERNLNQNFKHPATGQNTTFRRLFTQQVQAMSVAIEQGNEYGPFPYDR